VRRKAGLRQVKNEIAQAVEALKRSLERRRGNRANRPTPDGRGPQPWWKKILLCFLVGVSICVVISWAVFNIKPTWLASLKGRIEDRSSSQSVKQKKTPTPQHPQLAARTAKTRIVTTTAPTTSTQQQPKERVATATERPQVHIPERTAQPQDTPPPSLSPRVTTPPSLPPEGEGNVLDDYLEIGALYAQKGKYDKAEELFQKVAKENSSSAKAHNNLGFVYLKQEKYELAEKEFKEALRLDSASVFPYYNLACLYCRKGMEVEALIYLKRALKRDARVKLWAMTDEDFDGLRSDVVFEELVGISSSQTGGGEIFKQESTQKQESAQKRERTVIPRRIQIPLKTTAPEELEINEEVQAPKEPEEFQAPDDTVEPEEVQPPEEAQGNTTQ
jgi:tetratricopeptide (TPR) repeat protein